MESSSSSSPDSSDPQIPRSSNGSNASKKKRKLNRRQSCRLRKKMLLSKIQCQTADRSHLSTICVTRTVEWPATQNVGEEKNKLLFMLSIGLQPKPEAIQNQPSIQIPRLDPSVESKAKGKTKARIIELYKKREAADLRSRALQFLENAPARPPSTNNVEIVNLVSDEEGDDDDDDAECNQHDEITAQPSPILRRTTRPRLRVNGSSTCLTTDSEETSTIPSPQLQVIPSARIRTPMLSKKLDDNSLCYKRKPESYAKLVDQKKAKECALPPLNGTHKKVVVAATIRKGAPASSPLTVRNQASSPIMTTGRITGGLYKTQNSNGGAGARNGVVASVSIPENLIIDID